MVHTVKTDHQARANSQQLIIQTSDELDAGIQLSQSGKAIVTGLEYGDREVDVSLALAQNDHLYLCVAGVGAQGCDLASVDRRELSDWLALLGKSHQALLEKLTTQYSDSLDTAGTRIWSALKALQKATDSTEFKLELDRQDQDSIIFRGSALDTELYVLTCPVKLTRGNSRIVALIIPKPKSKPKTESTIVAENNYPQYQSELYCLDTVTDTDNNFFYVRFPVSYRQVANLSQTIYFSNFFSWIEQIRDLALIPIRKELGEHLATGKWGMVTNFAEVDILGEAGLDDGIESRIWIGKVSGSQNSTVNFNYDWLKVMPNGKKERIAFGKLQMTWVKLTKNAAPQPLALPQFIQEFIDRVPVYKPETLTESLRDVDRGEKLSEISARPDTSNLLKEEVFSTCLEETDAIGNINFQNYYIFQGRLRDGFFQSLIPEYYRRDFKQGEFRCLHSKVDFLREAFPFDRLEVKMYLQALSERSVNLIFEYFRFLPNGTKEKLAVGQQEAIWLVTGSDGKSVSAPMPMKVRTALLKSGQ